jgi:beta-galactosidase
VGTYFSGEVLAALEPVLAKLGAIKPPALAVPGVETVVRAGAGKRLRFVINHNETAVRVNLPAGGHELITDKPVAGEIELAGGEVAVVRETT